MTKVEDGTFLANLKSDGGDYERKSFLDRTVVLLLLRERCLIKHN